MIELRKKDEEKQKCIKEAVVQLILQEGFHGASIAKIAKLAGVSPATVYIYYENKEDMLRNIYEEYAEDSISRLLDGLSPRMSGEEVLASLIRQYYFFIVDNREVYNFIEQYATCPALYSTCDKIKGPGNLNKLLTELKERQILKNFNNDNIYAMIFYPVKSIAVKSCKCEETVEERLEELIYIIQKALIY